MRLQANNSCAKEHGRAEGLNFLSETEEVPSVRMTNRRTDKFFERSLSRVAIVGLDDAAEFSLAPNASGELRLESLVQHLVVHADTSVRS